MAKQDELDISSDDLVLAPLEDQEVETGHKGRAKFQIDTRNGAERRKHEERRNAIRFQEERRSGKDRRLGSNPWAPGVDI